MTCLQNIKNHIKQKNKNKKSKSLSTMQKQHGRVVTLHDHLTFLLSIIALTTATICLMPITQTLTEYSAMIFWIITITYMAIVALTIRKKKVKKQTNQKRKKQT